VDYSESFQMKGLPVVTVLIGVFDRTSGKPIAGVVNQPFVKYDHKENK
jgi:inositol polyphosphate 1-phosphatase